MGMSHMDHDDREMRVAFSQKSDLPRKGEWRMTGMDEQRFSVFLTDLSYRIHTRIIGTVAVKEGLKLCTGKVFVTDIML